MIRSAALAALACGCWTGPVAPPPAAPAPPPRVHHHAPFELTMQRTACMGMCPVYKVVIHENGDIEWTGIANVAEVGVRHGHVSPVRLDELARALDVAKFDQRDETGQLPVAPVCTPTGPGTSTCSISMSFSGCSDTPHAIITVRRGTHTHTVENAHCDPSPLDALEDRIDRIANTGPWVGR